MRESGLYPAAPRGARSLRARTARPPARARSLAAPGSDRRRRAHGGRRPRPHRDRAAHRPRMPVALRDVRPVELYHVRRHAARRDSRRRWPPRALPCASGPVPVTGMKLYNAGSFFDPRAVPEADYDDVAAALAGLSRVDRRIASGAGGSARRSAARGARSPYADLRTAPQLEVAMGLETAHPDALDRLNKRFTLERLRDRPPRRSPTAAWRCACSC